MRNVRLLSTAVLATSLCAADIMQWTRYEAELTAETANNSLQTVTLAAEFRSPAGKTHRVSGFWDGGATWRVRFSPNETGLWTWATRSNHAGLDQQRGSFKCIPYKGDNPLYQHGALKVSTDRHRFVHADGTPFFWLGDTVWNGVLLSDSRDWDVFLRDRSTKGFNVIQYVTTRWSSAYADATGRVPFRGRERIEIDPVFFQRMDERVNAINQHGHIAAPVLLWAHPSQPDLNPGVQLPEDQMIVLARYLVARYGAHQAIWFLNGDGNYSGANADRWKRIGRSVFTETHPDRLVTLHPGRMTWVTDDFAGEEWLHFNGYQSGHRDDEEHLRWLTEGPPSKSWKRAEPVPDINLEPNYEAHRSRTAGATHLFDAHAIRRAAYWSCLVAPTAGVTYGAHGVWSWEARKAEPLNHKGTGFAPPWNEAMRLPGSSDMQRLKQFFASLPWATLLPAPDALAEQPGKDDHKKFVAVAQSVDGSVLVAYTPVGGRLRLTAASGKSFSRKRWFNPRNGEYANAAGTAGAYETPDAQDWLLLLERR